jgi:hypothetical protein
MADEITREALEPGLSADQIQTLIELRVNAGASSCRVEEEGGHSYLVCTWPGQD